MLLSVAVCLLQSCEPKDYKSVGDPVTPITSLMGTWKINKVTQADENAKYLAFNNPSINVQEQDITTVYPYADLQITFNGNGLTPTTFTTVLGNSPAIVKLTNGNWTTDNPTVPTIITLTNGTITQQLTISAYPTPASPVLKLIVQKKDATTNKLLVSYTYEFIKK